jgi:hypothetical protein
MGLLDILTQAMSQPNTHEEAENHFGNAMQHASPDILGGGLAEAFRSNQTPAIGDMVGQLFGQSNGNQQAGMLNSLMGSMGPALLATLAGGAISKMMQPGQTQITPEQAQKLSPQQVQAIVNEAHAKDPSVADNLGSFYANHKGLVNTLGGIAATVAMMKMKDSLGNRE